MTLVRHPVYRKLDRIPAAPNFVRYNFADLQSTLKAYVQFAKGMPTVSYQKGLILIRDIIFGMTNPGQAQVAARRLPPSPSREPVIEFVDAFVSYAETRHYLATPSYQDFSTYFSIGRDLLVPVRPTLIAREKGQLKPIFVFGWKSVPLTLFQRRLLMTILDDAIFSLTDFQSSDAEILFLPIVDGQRQPEVWHRGEYDLLSPAELSNQMEIFLSARDAAYPIIDKWLSKDRPTVAPAEEPPVDPDFLNLLGRPESIG